MLFRSNDYINSVEQLKLFFGDLSFYKDFFKRTKGAIGTKSMPRNDRYINDSEAVSNLKSVHKRDDAGNIILQSESIENSVLVIEPIALLPAFNPTPQVPL